MNLKYFKKKISIIVLFVVLQLLCYIDISYAAEMPPEISSPAVILIEANSGKVLYEKNSTEAHFPASTTKVMTALLAIENCNLSDKVTVSANAINSVPYSYTTSGLKEGETFTVEQMLYLCLLPSANDAANVLAEHIGGSISGFASMMNQKAAELGCTGTHFTNPSGAHDPEHFTNAHDLALIGQAALKSEEYMNIIKHRNFSLPNTNIYTGPERVFTSSNALISPDSQYYYEYATGLKTGYTNAASYCIIASAHKNDTNLVCVILGATKNEEGKSTRDIECKKLFEYGFSLYQTQNVIKSGSVAKQVTIYNATKESRNLDLIVKDDINILIESKKSDSDLLANISVNPNLQAPISQGQVLGTISYTVDGDTYSSDLLAANDVERSRIYGDIIKISAGVILILLALKLATMQPEESERISKKRTKNKSYKNNKKNTKSNTSKNVKKNSRNSKKSKSYNSTKSSDNEFDLFEFATGKTKNKNYRKNTKKK